MRVKLSIQLRKLTDENMRHIVSPESLVNLYIYDLLSIQNKNIVSKNQQMFIK